MYPRLAALAVVLAFAAPALATPAGGELKLYVSSTGNDAWSGTSPTRGKVSGPFASLGRARDAVRERRASGTLSGPVRVLVQPGTYHLAEPLVLGPDDSGVEGAEITYAAAQKGRVSLRGSRLVTGWQPWREGIFRAQLPPEVLSAGPFWQLYCDGKRQTLARYPNPDPQHPRSGGFLYVPGVVEQGSKTLLQYNPAKLDPAKWSKPADVRVHVWSWLNWNRSILPLKSADTTEHVLTLGAPAAYMISTGNRFFVENALEELDSPGEWYCDRSSGLLYFRPPDGRNPEGRVSVPVLSNLISLQGEPERFVSRVRFSGFDLSESRDSLLTMKYSDNCTLAASTLRHCGGTAVRVSNGCHHDSIIGCDIANVGGAAISLEDTVDWTHRPEGHLHHNLVSNNHVHDVGEGGDAWGAIGLWPGCGGNASYDNVISHNLIHDTPRQGITFNGMGNVVEYNVVHHTNQEQSDTGAIGMGSRDIYERGSVVRYNYVHDTGGYNMLKPGVWEYPHYCWGVYLDDYTSGVRVYGNLLVRTYLGGVMIHGGQDNLVENNIIVDGAAQQLQYAPIDSLTSGRTPGHPDTSLWLMSGNRCRRNIFCYRGEQTKWLVGGKWDQIISESDRNLVWHYGQPVLTNQAGVADGDYWASWQKLGFDRNSILADPLFVDPRRDDYRLREDSPAFRLGFRPLPLQKIGLYASPDRATWPVKDDQWREQHLKYPEGDPALLPKPARLRIPELTAVRRTAPPVIDGKVEAPEWQWQPELTATVAALSMSDGKGKQPSRALVTYDDRALYVALVNPVTDSETLPRQGGTWGADDGAEICLQDVSGARPGPVFIVQGYPSGKTESKPDAGAPAAAVSKLGAAVTYAAGIAPGVWTGEWRIPFAELGVDPAKARSLLFNIGVLKKTEGQWIAWVSTGGAPWHLDLAGKLMLQQ